METIVTIQAGGPGSGCNGPNCGRPRGDGGHRYTAKQRERMLKRFASPMPKNVPGLTKQGQIEKGEPVRKGLIRQQFLTNTGAQYTVIKSPRARGGDYKPQTGASKFKGQFRHEQQVVGNEKTRLADVMVSKPDSKGRGQTLIVHRDYGKGRVVIQEFSTGQFGHIEQEKEYKFKNSGQAQGFLNSRYGVRLTLPKPGWNV